MRDAHAYSRARSRYLYGWALVVGGDTEGGEAVLHDVAEEWFSLHLMLVEGAHSVARCDIDLLGVSAAAWGTLGMLAVRAGDWTVAERHLHASLRAGLAASLAAKLLAFGGKGGGGAFPGCVLDTRIVVSTARVLCRFADVLVAVWQDRCSVFLSFAGMCPCLLYLYLALFWRVCMRSFPCVCVHKSSL